MNLRTFRQMLNELALKVEKLGEESEKTPNCRFFLHNIGTCYVTFTSIKFTEDNRKDSVICFYSEKDLNTPDATPVFCTLLSEMNEYGYHLIK